MAADVVRCRIVASDSAAEVRAANDAFYEAFELRDLDRMSDTWEHSDAASCTHPGWATLHGWGAVAASWYALFTNGQRLQFIVTGERVVVEGDVGWVSCDENVLGDGAGVGSTVAALNVFRRTSHGWKLVAHHGSGVAAG